jgi:hypothetical protein
MAGVFWVEGRTGGRDVLVRWTEERGSQDITPGGFQSVPGGSRITRCGRD